MTVSRWIGAIAGLLLVLGPLSAQAQSSADALFHEAAQRYVAGDRDGALRAVERGLKVAPSDSRLQALREKLEQQRKKRRGGGPSSQAGRQGQSQDQRSRGQQSQQQQPGEAGTESRAQGEKSSGQRASPSSEASDARSESSGRRGPEAGPAEGDSQGRTALSRAQAARLLRALERQEMKLLREVQSRGQTSGSATVTKDW
jgi:hypothetical protein